MRASAHLPGEITPGTSLSGCCFFEHPSRAISNPRRQPTTAHNSPQSSGHAAGHARATPVRQARLFHSSWPPDLIDRGPTSMINCINSQGRGTGRNRSAFRDTRDIGYQSHPFHQLGCFCFRSYGWGGIVPHSAKSLFPPRGSRLAHLGRGSSMLPSLSARLDERHQLTTDANGGHTQTTQSVVDTLSTSSSAPAAPAHTRVHRVPITVDINQPQLDTWQSASGASWLLGVS